MSDVAVKYKSINSDHGVYTIEPLERGFGTTIGNSLRRVLLSSMKGAAVSSVQIDGVEHEFATIDGVKEDVFDILMNIKNLVVKSYSDEPKEISISKKGAGNITAADIVHDDEIEIINKKHHIATLNKSGKFDIKMIVTKGQGYVPSELNASKKGPINTIYLDASYSPIVKVNHTVEPTRVGKRIDFDKLTLEIWTNGAISPEDAVKKSSSILRNKLAFFQDSELEAAQVKKEEKQPEVAEVAQDERFSLSIDDLNISSRTSNSLKRAGVMTIGELLSKPIDELMDIRNFGKKALVELNEKLQEIDLKLEGDLDSIEDEE